MTTKDEDEPMTSLYALAMHEMRQKRATAAPPPDERCFMVTGAFPDGRDHLCWQGTPAELDALKLPFECEECGTRYDHEEELEEATRRRPATIAQRPLASTAPEADVDSDLARLRELMTSAMRFDMGRSTGPVWVLVQAVYRFDVTPVVAGWEVAVVDEIRGIDVERPCRFDTQAEALAYGEQRLRMLRKEDAR